MGSGLPRIKRTRTYSPEQLALAVEAVNSKQCTIRAAQEMFGVPRSTIFGVIYRMKKKLGLIGQPKQ
ncbi:Hypothetical predicted protein [Mytilus galloprovincialis]|uniref:HTH psq-type domain-containing protein n=1 Tax=Mytilus galloprovincialis TaxID=29158 RepID=A0A8B6F271_MYTGA|nr:Hypothetical predicted protein [Mytilus galloprovincialis]